MPRGTRIFIVNACYHITSRGNQKQPVFKEDEDYRAYLGILRKAKVKHKVLLYAYCLMPNHAHLLVDPSLLWDMSRFMHWLNRGYTAYFNQKYDKVGHLWQGRYRSRAILRGEYLINAANYIEANPVRAKIVEDMAKYKWSSYVERCFSDKNDLLDEIRVDTAEAVRGQVEA